MAIKEPVLVVEPISVTVKQAAALTGIGETQIYKAAEEGKLKRRMKGTRGYVILYDSLRKWIQSLPEFPEGY